MVLPCPEFQPYDCRWRVIPIQLDWPMQPLRAANSLGSYETCLAICNVQYTPQLALYGLEVAGPLDLRLIPTFLATATDSDCLSNVSRNDIASRMHVVPGHKKIWLWLEFCASVTREPLSEHKPHVSHVLMFLVGNTRRKVAQTNVFV